MSVRVLYDSERREAVLICTTSDTAFGPIFCEDPKSEWTAAETAEFFLRWLPFDAREFPPDKLEDARNRFLAAKPTECRWYRCGHPRKDEKKPAAAYDYYGEPNPAHAEGYCSDECRDNDAEDNDERQRDAYYGASTPQTEGERYAAAAEEERRLG